MGVSVSRGTTRDEVPISISRANACLILFNELGFVWEGNIEGRRIN